MADGGWVATHEDITERRDAERERASMQEQQQRRSVIEQAIAAFRQRVEEHLQHGGRRRDGDALHRHHVVRAIPARPRSAREGAVSASNEACTNVETAAVAADELAGSIGEIGRQLAMTTTIVRAAVERSTRDQRSRSPRWRRPRRRSAT